MIEICRRVEVALPYFIRSVDTFVYVGCKRKFDLKILFCNKSNIYAVMKYQKSINISVFILPILRFVLNMYLK